jgi:hypothetical protein
MQSSHQVGFQRIKKGSGRGTAMAGAASGLGTNDFEMQF